MKILFISDEPIRNDTSVGNTFLNLFKNFEDVELACICTRNGAPDEMIKKCYCITEKMIVKSIFGKGPAGIIVEERRRKYVDSTVEQSTLVRYVKKLRWTVFFWMQNIVWRTGKWKNESLKSFLDDFSPDLVFTYLSNCEYLNYLILHIKEITNKGLVVYAWDNNYSLRQVYISPLRWLRRILERKYMHKVVDKANLFYVISNVQKNDYERAFNRECKVLTKSACFSEQIVTKRSYNKPLQLVYTGNIALNRWKSLACIANVLEKINSNGVKAQLRIYTGNTLTKKMLKTLNKGDSSFFIGSVSADKIKDIQNDADMLVHVEALDLKNKLTVRQSFSTKIVDYLAASRPILAFGPKKVASIEHFIINDCAIVADNEDELYDKLCAVIDNKCKLNELSHKAFECGKKFHNKEDIDNMLRNDLEQLIKGV